MTEGKGVSMSKCPAGFDVCYPWFHCQDCLFWRNDRCDYEAFIAGEEIVAQPAIVSPELSEEERQEEVEEAAWDIVAIRGMLKAEAEAKRLKKHLSGGNG